MEIQLIRHATTVLQIGGKRLLIDPLLSRKREKHHAKTYGAGIRLFIRAENDGFEPRCILHENSKKIIVFVNTDTILRSI